MPARSAPCARAEGAPATVSAAVLAQCRPSGSTARADTTVHPAMRITMCCRRLWPRPGPGAERGARSGVPSRQWPSRAAARSPPRTGTPVVEALDRGRQTVRLVGGSAAGCSRTCRAFGIANAMVAFFCGTGAGTQLAQPGCSGRPPMPRVPVHQRPHRHTVHKNDTATVTSVTRPDCCASVPTTTVVERVHQVVHRADAADAKPADHRARSLRASGSPVCWGHRHRTAAPGTAME